MSSMYMGAITELVSQPVMSALKAVVFRNMLAICVTELVFQPEMSALKADAL